MKHLLLLTLLPTLAVTYLTTKQEAVAFTPFENAAKIQAALDECRRNNNSTDSTQKQAEQCYVRFERDTSTRYYCTDASCDLSEDIASYLGTSNPGSCTPSSTHTSPNTNTFFMDERFVVRNAAPQSLPCDLVLFNSQTPCSDQPVVDRAVNNFLNADFECPQYQTSSCCSSNARFGFSYDTPYASHPADVHNPFSRAHARPACQLQRRSASGNTCGSRADGWNVFSGVGVCGVRDCIGNGCSGTYSASAFTQTADFVRNAYCEPAAITGACETYRSEWENSQETCSGDLGNFQKFNYRQYCDTYQATTGVALDLVQELPLPPLSLQDKAKCQHCRALNKALHCFPCSGRQGEFVSNGEFRVCSSTCDLLFDTCGLPNHRGGHLMTSTFNSTSGTFAGDYTDGPSLCHALWNPHAESIWAVDGIQLRVVDDSVSGHDKCVSFERETFMLNFDTQNFIFDYGAIRQGNGYCKLQDPLYNPDTPCADLEVLLDQQNTTTGQKSAGRKSAGSAGPPMYALDDEQRGFKLDDGWPYESDSGISTTTIIIIVVCATAGLCLLTICCVAVFRQKGKKAQEGKGAELSDQRGAYRRQ